MSLTGKPSLTTAAPFINDGFWPDLSLGDLMNRYRIPAEYADETIQWGLTLAVTNVNLDLEAVKTQIQALGHATLNAYNTAAPKQLNGVYVTVIRYQQAVFSLAKAFLLQQFNSLNRKPEAENAAKEANETEQWWRDQSQQAVAELFALILPNQPVSANANVHVALI